MKRSTPFSLSFMPTNVCLLELDSKPRCTTSNGVGLGLEYSEMRATLRGRAFPHELRKSPRRTFSSSPQFTRIDAFCPDLATLRFFQLCVARLSESCSSPRKKSDDAARDLRSSGKVSCETTELVPKRSRIFFPGQLERQTMILRWLSWGADKPPLHRGRDEVDCFAHFWKLKPSFFFASGLVLNSTAFVALDERCSATRLNPV